MLAAFDDGATESPNLGPLSGAMHNILARSLHDIGAGAPDERQFLKTWRRQLNDCLQLHSAQMVQFLITDLSNADIMDSATIRRCNDVLSKFAKPSWSFTSSMRDISNVGPPSNIDAELGISVADFKSTFKKVVRLYVDSATALCMAESRLEDKLKRIESVVGRVNDLMFLEPTAALETMGEPTRIYLDSVLSKMSLEEDYTEILTQYRRFSALRPLIMLSGFQKSTVPTCSICMTKEVSLAVTPCGHTYCEDCCKAQMTACYICRVQIRDKVRLFFA